MARASAAQEAFRAVQRTAGHRRRHRLVYAAGPHQRSAGVAAALGQLQAGRLLLLEEDAEHLTGLGAAKERSLDHGSTHMQVWLLPSGPAARGPGRGR
jgi:hypothetical protein